MLTSPLLLAAAVVPTVMAQSANLTFLAGFLNTLQTAGLTQIATLAQSLNSTSVGQNILAELSNGSPSLLFAPNNAACTYDPRSGYCATHTHMLTSSQFANSAGGFRKCQ